MAAATYVSEQTLTKTIFAAASGTMIEWYDFYMFGSMAAVISASSIKPAPRSVT